MKDCFNHLACVEVNEISNIPDDSSRERYYKAGMLFLLQIWVKVETTQEKYDFRNQVIQKIIMFLVTWKYMNQVKLLVNFRCLFLIKNKVGYCITCQKL